MTPNRPPFLYEMPTSRQLRADLEEDAPNDKPQDDGESVETRTSHPRSPESTLALMPPVLPITS